MGIKKGYEKNLRKRLYNYFFFSSFVKNFYSVINYIKSIMEQKSSKTKIKTTKPLRKVILYKGLWMFFFTVLFSLLSLPILYAQQGKTVSGKVTDSSDTPLPGVTVVVKGTTQGTVTDADGNYSLINVSSGATLMFSFVGMKTKEVAVSDRTTFTVVMEEYAIGLEEVVAIGYGTQKKITVTGSVVSTQGQDVLKSQTPNVINAMTGLLPGVIVNSRSGEPGKDDPTIYIRGRSTTGDNNPLVIIDGVEREDLGRINPNDIDNISVLKDASAAIYGARAGNGVILVTTKRGMEGTPTINFSFNQGFTQPTRKPIMANAYTWATVYNEIEVDAGRSQYYTDEEVEKYRIGTEPGYQTTDWYDYMTRTLTPEHRTNLSVSGGNKIINYYLSFGELAQEGHFNYGTTKIKRYNFRSNIGVNVTDFLKVDFNLAGRYDDNHYPTSQDTRNSYAHIYLYWPQWTAYWPGTDLLRPLRDSENIINWVSDNGGWQSANFKGIESSLKFTLNVPWIKGLSAIGAFSYDAGFNYNKTWRMPTYVYYYNASTEVYTKGRTGSGPNLAQLTEEFNQNSQTLLNAQINYDRKFGSHNIRLMVGSEQKKYKYNSLNASRKDFPSVALPQLFAGSSDKQKQSNNGSAFETARVNYFGRATYDFAQKYLAQLIFRYDGSPNFPKDKRWGFFPGVSLGWRISEEPFMSGLDLIDNLKIRASYGEMGNDRVTPFQYLTGYSYGTNYVIANSDVLGLTQSGVANPEITWEVEKSTNFGFESTMWKGLLGVEFDLFKMERSNILTKRTVVIPDYTGLKLPDENIGIVENKGFELQLSHQNTINKLRYSLKGNISFARNKVIFADEAPAAEEYQKATGLPIGSALYYEAIGIFSTQEEVNSYPHLAGARPGDIKYKDVNNDLVLNSRDQIRIDKTSTPEIVYGFNTAIHYANFDCSILFQGQANAKVFFGGYFPIMSYAMGNFTQYRAEDHWSVDNIDATQPRGSVETSNNNNLNSTHWLVDAGFLKLKNVELGYSLPSSISNKLAMKNLRVYVSGYNLLILYDHMKDMGFDPETNDYWYYPQQRTFNFGVNLTF